MNNINSAFLETKANNRLNALRLLFANESLSRTEIASFLGISTAAVTSIVNEFLESGLIIQCEESVDSPNKKAGRKQSPLKINYNWKYIVCFDIHPASVNIAITNLHGKLIVEEPFTFSSNWNKKEFCSELAKECIKILWNHSIHLNQILGAGVSVIGPVNHLEGIALHPYRVFEGPVPFKELLENELPFPITVESNVCAFLQSELLYRTNIENAQNILMLKWEPGVGSATAINGHIYKGYNYQSSEIGHNHFAKGKGAKCICGRNGCLETLISEAAIIDHIKELMHSENGKDILEFSKTVGEPCSANLESYLNHPNQELREYVSKCSFDLAEVTNNAILILAPDKLVLFGDIFEHDSIVSLFTEQLVEINSTLPEQFCVKSTFRKKKKYIGSTAIAVENFLLS